MNNEGDESWMNCDLRKRRKYLISRAGVLGTADVLEIAVLRSDAGIVETRGHRVDGVGVALLI